MQKATIYLKDGPVVYCVAERIDVFGRVETLPQFIVSGTNPPGTVVVPADQLVAIAINEVPA